VRIRGRLLKKSPSGLNIEREKRLGAGLRIFQMEGIAIFISRKGKEKGLIVLAVHKDGPSLVSPGQ